MPGQLLKPAPVVPLRPIHVLICLQFLINISNGLSHPAIECVTNDVVAKVRITKVRITFGSCGDQTPFLVQ